MKLHCLSIQQPLVEDIFNGYKPVENRSWTWMMDRDWESDGPVLLGIHASSNRRLWNELTDEEREDCCSDFDVDEPPFGAVVGVVDLVNICRPRDLPPDLRDHECVNPEPDSWCWVLDNPRRFAQPVRAAGNARLFFVDIPDALIRSNAGTKAGRHDSSVAPAASKRPQIVRAAVREYCWVYWPLRPALLAVKNQQTFSTADLGSFSVGKRDVIWLVSYHDGHLILCGRLAVGSIEDIERAQQVWLQRSLWDLDAWPPPFPVPGRAHPDSYFDYQKDRVCVFAEDGTEEPYRFVPLDRVAAQLRFQSKTRDRLTVEGGRVVPQEVVNPRRLTRDGGAILEEVWAQ
jgi:hypothetical protein